MATAPLDARAWMLRRLRALLAAAARVQATGTLTIWLQGAAWVQGWTWTGALVLVPDQDAAYSDLSVRAQAVYREMGRTLSQVAAYQVDGVPVVAEVRIPVQRGVPYPLEVRTHEHYQRSDHPNVAA